MHSFNHQTVLYNISYVKGTILDDWQYSDEQNKLPALIQLTFQFKRQMLPNKVLKEYYYSKIGKGKGGETV